MCVRDALTLQTPAGDRRCADCGAFLLAVVSVYPALAETVCVCVCVYTRVCVYTPELCSQSRADRRWAESVETSCRLQDGDTGLDRHIGNNTFRQNYFLVSILKSMRQRRSWQRRSWQRRSWQRRSRQRRSRHGLETEAVCRLLSSPCVRHSGRGSADNVTVSHRRTTAANVSSPTPQRYVCYCLNSGRKANGNSTGLWPRPDQTGVDT